MSSTIDKLTAAQRLMLSVLNNADLCRQPPTPKQKKLNEIEQWNQCVEEKKAAKREAKEARKNEPR